MRNNFSFGDKHDMNSLFASTARGLEELLKASWKRLALTTAKWCRVGYIFRVTIVFCTKACCGAAASRILLPLNEFRVHSDLDLYLGAGDRLAEHFWRG